MAALEPSNWAGSAPIPTGTVKAVTPGCSAIICGRAMTLAAAKRATRFGATSRARFTDGSQSLYLLLTVICEVSEV